MGEMEESLTARPRTWHPKSAASVRLVTELQVTLQRVNQWCTLAV